MVPRLANKSTKIQIKYHELSVRFLRLCNSMAGGKVVPVAFLAGGIGVFTSFFRDGIGSINGFTSACNKGWCPSLSLISGTGILSAWARAIVREEASGNRFSGSFARLHRMTLARAEEIV